jgi:hypothetical protein
MDECSKQNFLNKKRAKGEDLQNLINNKTNSKISKSDSERKINESKYEIDVNNYHKMMKILKTIESRDKIESCMLCSKYSKDESALPINSIEEYVYLCNYLYSTDEIKSSSNYKISLTNFSTVFIEHQSNDFKDIIFKYIISICKQCLTEQLKSPKGFNITYQMLLNKNSSDNKSRIDSIFNILNQVKTPSECDISNLFNVNGDNIEKMLEDIKNKFFVLQYDYLFQKLFLSYVFSNMETFLGELTKSQIISDKIMDNTNRDNLTQQLLLLKNMYRYGCNLINELKSNFSQLKANANKVFRNDITGINESINTNNIDNNVNNFEWNNQVIGDFNFGNYLSPELNTQLLFNQLASYNQILKVFYY